MGSREERAASEGGEGGGEVADVTVETFEKARAREVKGFGEPCKAVTDACVTRGCRPDMIASVVVGGGAEIEARGSMGGPGATCCW